MFGSIGLFEIVVIAGVALMVLGPEKFPEYAKLAARFIRDVRSYADEVKSEVAKEINPVKMGLEDLSKIDPEKYIDSLIKDDEPEEDAPINPEPDPSPIDLGIDESGAEDAEEEEPDPSGYDQPEIEGDYTYPFEQEDMEPGTDQPERLDG